MKDAFLTPFAYDFSRRSAVLVNGEMVDLNQFLFEGLQGFVIQSELELERTVRHAPTALEQDDRLVEDLLKIHC